MEFSDLSILIIDDENDFANTLATRLELRGMTVKVAYSGEQGLEMLKNNAFDILLLDMRMPGLTGLDVLTDLRAFLPDLPVIIISGHCHEQDQDSAHALGIQGYLAKPLDFSELLHLIHINIFKD